MSSQKRNRSLNWDEEEKQIFRSVLKDYVQILENKSLDTNTTKLKAKAWDEINVKFNELNCRQRDTSQLKVQWKTMKMYARKRLSNYNKETNNTSGYRPDSPSEERVEINSLINPAEILGDSNHYDSDEHCVMANEDYVSKMVSHTEMLKDIEHKRRMEMMEEDHRMKMAIQQEKLKTAVLEREIMELKKLKEENEVENLKRSKIRVENDVNNGI